MKMYSNRLLLILLLQPIILMKLGKMYLYKIDCISVLEYTLDNDAKTQNTPTHYIPWSTWDCLLKNKFDPLQTPKRRN